MIESFLPVTAERNACSGLLIHPTKEIEMGSTSDKIKGKTNEVVGKARQAVGKAADNREEQAKGIVQEAKGKAQVAKGEAKDAVKMVVDKA
jgi:uncharacterized protein YjbJ (UPF0337 family)